MTSSYDLIGRSYDQQRRPDRRIAACILAALGDAASVVNVGAGTGSYEPEDRLVVAVEPSEVMVAQRPPDAPPVVRGSAEALQCTDGFFGAYWRRPEAYLDPGVRASISALARLGEAGVRPAIERLAADLGSGAWERRYGHLRALDEIDLGYRLVVSSRP